MLMTRTLRLTLVACLALPLLLSACGPEPPATAVPPTAQPVRETASPPPVATAPDATPVPVSPTRVPEGSDAVSRGQVSFAAFIEPEVQVGGTVEHEPIAPDLGNVRVPFVLSEAQRERLAHDGFVVSPGVEKEFFTVYEKARYANVPVFVTSDSLLHVYHLLFDKVLRTAEMQSFIPLLRQLNAALLERAMDQYEVLEDAAWKEAARRTVAFVGVGSRLLDPSVQVPDYARELVAAEMALIQEAAGIQPSPLFPGLPLGEDYTQYIPRGHYTLSEELERYFQSMMWYGRMTFRLKTDDAEVGRAETRMALLLALALRSADVAYRPALDVWADLYNPTAFFVGRSDDLTILQYLEIMDTLYGPGVTPATLSDRLTGQAKLTAFIQAASELPPPRILGMVIYDTDDVEETTTGMRFMGQRFVPDAYIFRQLIYRNVGTSDERRGLPKGLDLPAAMGSERAYEILDDMGDTAYANYPQQMAKVRGWVAGLSVEEWTETLYNSWLYTFRPLLEVPGAGYPAFMQSAAWVNKQLHTVLGSWAELKHDTILYAKQVYAEAGAGPMPPEPVPPRGYVEPVPLFYARLAALTAMTRSGLGERNLLAPGDAYSLQRLEELVRAFQTMAEKELRGEALSEQEEATIRFYGRELEHLTMAAADNPEAGEQGGFPVMDEEPQAAVIADVATDPDPGGTGALGPVVLEVGVGRIDEIHVVVPVVDDDGSTYLQVAKGGVFSYYEFPWPAEDRLTDEAWRKMLDTGEAPDRPGWIESFWTAEGEFSELTQAIFSFQESLGLALWFLEPAYLRAAGDVGDQVGAQIDAMLAEDRYEGRQLLATDLRSFDLQASDRAVVTARETWQDALYELTSYAGEGGRPLAQRGPYTLDVTYTLQRVQDSWVVSRAVYANEPPAWEE
jgi:hypothetical protein